MPARKRVLRALKLVPGGAVTPALVCTEQAGPGLAVGLAAAACLRGLMLFQVEGFC